MDQAKEELYKKWLELELEFNKLFEEGDKLEQENEKFNEKVNSLPLSQRDFLNWPKEIKEECKTLDYRKRVNEGAKKKLDNKQTDLMSEHPNWVNEFEKRHQESKVCSEKEFGEGSRS